MESFRGSTDRATGLSVYLSPLAVLALSFGYAVGWGAFVMPGKIFLPDAGPAGTLIGIAIGAAAMLVFAFNYHRMVIRSPGPGGALTFASKAFGPDHGFIIAWFLILTYVAILWANATALVLLARYVAGDTFQFGFHYTMAGFDVYLGEVLLCILAIVFCGGACLFRKRFAIRLHTLLAIAFVGCVAVCFFAALFRHDGGVATMAPHFAQDTTPTIQVLRIIAMMPWAFVGFEAVVNSSAEFRFPAKRTFSLLAAAIVLSAAVYALLAILPVLSLPDGYATWADYIADIPNLKGTDSMPVFAAARKALGPAGIAVIGGAMLAAQLTGLFGTYIASSRLMYAMSNEAFIPRWFGELNKDGTPANAIIFVMCASVAIPFFGRTVTGWPVDISNFGAVIAYGYTSAAAFALPLGKRNTGRFILAKAAGACGIVSSAIFGLLMLVPNYLSGSTLSAEAYLLLAVWCILGFLVYRRAFKLDGENRLGHSTVVWISVLVTIFFSALMWLRLAVCDATEDVFDGFIGKTVTQDYLTPLIRHVNADMLLNSVVVLVLLIASLSIMLSLFAILRRREKDMTLKKLEAEESASKSRSYFFSTVSHDIRTPLNSIIGFSQMLKMGMKTASERDQAVNSIILSGQTLLRLINDVLDFSKLESGRMEIIPEPTDCGKLAAELAETFRIANKNPELEIHCHASGMPILEVDPQRIRQMLFNFLGNAVKFTKAGLIEVRASFAKDPEDERGTFKLEVEDTGCGIGEEDLKLIASPYVQVRSKAARHGGTGLGLSICRQLASAMGGEMTIASTLGKGSTFTVTIPNVKTGTLPPEPEPEPKPVATSEKKRILIVDDQKMNLMVLKAMLSKIGPFEITMASDGKKALEILKAQDAPQFDLVLTDMWMPELDGAGLVNAIRANAKLSALPTYVVTADVEMLKQYGEKGFSGILLKPITLDKLKDILK